MESCRCDIVGPVVRRFTAQEKLDTFVVKPAIYIRSYISFFVDKI